MTIRWHWWTILIFNLISLIYSLQSLDANSVRVDSDGSVKVKVNGVEGRICATDWDDKDAEVLCRGFGWSNSAAYNSSGDSNIPTLATEFDCQGSEARLEDCSYTVVGDNGSTCRPYSSTYNSAFAYCYNQSSEVIFSLEHGNYGRVLVTKDGYERYLCVDGYFSYSSGNVLCRGMGYRSGRDYPYSGELQITAVTAWWKNTFNCGGSEPSYAACIRSTWESRTGPVSPSDQCVYNTPSAYCFGTVRLHTPYRNSSGVLGVYHAEQYRGVCADGFDQNAINVVCNSLGFQGGQLGRDSYYNGSPYGIHISNVSCIGTEKSFDQCTYQFSENQINSCTEKVVLSCFDPNDPDSSLPDSSIKLDNMGRVLIKQYGMWGTICYDGWDDKDAEVACKQLGYDKGTALQIQLDNYKPRFYKNMNCSGSETSLDECSREVVSGYCYYTFDSGAYCYNSSSSAPSFSLIDGNSTNAGKVQITIEGETRYLCDKSGYFNYQEANLVCRNLGFISGQEYKEIETHEFPYGAPFWSNNVNCQNRVDFVDACTNGPWVKETNNGQSTCYYNVPAVYCYGIVRLHTPFRNTSGVLAIYHAEGYHGVCADGFDQNAINVVCNSLGFQGGQLGRDSYFGGSPYGIRISNVSCTGMEKSFNQCTYQYSENQIYSCSEKVVLSCFDPNDPDSSLPDGSIKFGQQSRILIKQYGMWGTICYDGWDDKDAEVACKQLGYDKGSALQIQHNNNIPRFYKNMNCSGSETSLDECNKEVVSGGCYYTFDAGAYCSNGIEANQYSLVHGDGVRYGRLMVTRHNETGFVCSPNYSFDYAESNVMCRQFGFTEGEKLNMPVLEPGYGTVFWENGIDCYTNVPSIDACLQGLWHKYIYQGPFDGNTCRYHIPSMFCYGQVRLHTKYLNTTGAVLVRHNEKWIAVCNDGFDDKAAQVVCGEMGFVSGMGQVLPNNSYDNSIVTSNWHPSVMAVRCHGHERSFNECSYTIDESRMNCSSTNFISVSCVPHTTTALPMPTTTPSYVYTSPSYSVPIASTNDTAWERNRIVSVKQNGMWGGVCSEGWDDVDALVFCKEFGYEMGMTLRIYRDDHRPLWFYNVRCTGSEASFMDCPHDMQDSQNGTCRYSGRAAAFCYNQAELAQYRLTGASKENMGRVEVFTQNKWALLCDLNGFYGDKANIICQTMGYKYGENYYSNNLNNVTGSYWSNSFSCEHGMRILEACENIGWTYQDGYTHSQCSYSQPPIVYCYDEVRLSTRYANSSGAVLVFDGDNNYRSLCAAQFNANAANVVCRQLGFPSGGRLLPGSSYLTYSIPSNISYSCSGAESKLSDCSILASACASNNSYASVACIDDSAAPISGNDGDAIVDSQGQVLVLYHGIWGTVCSLDWGDQDASVVCKEAGHMYGKAYAKYDYGGYSNSRPVWIYGADCSGSEGKLKDCQLRNSDDANSTCRYSASAMAYCYNDTNSIQYSLVGSGSNYGFVQVTRDGKTGYICDDGGFYSNEANTACKDLGFAAGDNYPDQLDYSSNNNWWKSYLYCHNSEPTLQLCSSNNDWNYVSMNSSSYCMHNTLSVFCYGTLRLHTKFANSSGVLLKRENRNYYAFCSDGFNMNSANAVCKDLGFIKARLILPASVYNIGYSVRFFNLQCSDGATSMKQCTSVYNSNANCIGEAIAVACDDGKSLVTDGLTRILNDGIVQVSKNGMWGSISGYRWDDVDAQVICKEKGYGTGSSKYGMNHDVPRWMFEVNCQGSEMSILDCPYKTTAQNDSRYYSDAAVHCYSLPEGNEYRLEHGNHGRLIRTKDNKEGYVCDTGYVDYEDATVVCKTLGYSRGEKYTSPGLYNVSGTNWGVDISCYSGYPVLESCITNSNWTYGTAQNNYMLSSCNENYHMMSVYCYGKVKLHLPFGNGSGIILVQSDYNGEVAVCADGFDLTEGDVACREMGYSGISRVIPAASYSYLSYQIGAYRFNCNGGESSLLNCSYTNETCSYGNYAAVECGSYATTTAKTYYNGTNQPYYNTTYPPYYNTTNPPYYYTTSPPYYSNNSDTLASTNNIAWMRNRRVTVKQNGMWRGICFEGWDDVDATVFCKELGYEAGMALPIYLYDEKVRWGYNVRCSGSEPSLLDCPYDTKSDNGSCSYGPEAGAFCYNTSELAQYRLIGGSKPNMGRVEVFTQNKWALLCDTYGFHGEKANIVCKSMGYKSGETYFANDLNNMTGNYWKTSFSSCEYGMRLLEACKISDWKYQTASSYSECSYSQPASVYCYNEVRLSTMYANSSGAVLVFDGDNNYRSLCAAQFNANAANVVCRQLGFPSGGRLLPGSSYLTYSIPSNISYSCSGAESKLSDCSILASACASNNSYASVACIDDSAAPISGNDGDAIVDSQGQVLVLYHGIWGTVCSLDWGDQDASVVCKEAGHMYGKAYAKYDYGGYSNSRPVWIYGADCSGSEGKLKDCQLRNSDDANSTCRYSASAMAYCYNDTNSIQYSLVGSGSNYGFVQVTRDGKTGYICDDGGFYSNEANTACKDLGFAAGDNYPVQLDYSSNNNWWKSYLYCHNSEPTLQLCSSNNDWNYVSMNSSSYCMHNTLSVFCYGTLRLHTKFANSSGVLLKRENRDYYAFCSDGFNMNSANAVCKDLGFIKARLILPASVYNIGYSVRFFNLQCSDGATSMKQCTSAYNSNANCIGEAIAVACDDGKSLVTDGLIRILNDGIVQVSKNGMWGSISGYRWDDIDAQVICKEKGYGTGSSKYGMNHDVPRWMFEVNCQGSEMSILDCPYKTTAQNDSRYYRDAAVHCYSLPEGNEYRLEHGNHGRLIRTKDNKEGYVCDTGYVDYEDATVVCKTLGYSRGEKYTSPGLYNVSGTNWWGVDISCYSGYPVLESCITNSNWTYGTAQNNYMLSSCNENYHMMSVYCYGKVKLHLPFGNGSGIILVQSDYNGEVAVCADGFDLTEGDVACREMGYSGISRVIPAASYSYLSYQIGAYRFNCNGGESSLLNCSYTNETCSYANYAAVECGSYATTTAKTYYNGTNQPYYNTTYPPYYNTTNPPYYNTTNPPYYYTTSPPYYSNNSDTLASTNNIAWMRNRRVTVKQNGMWRGICFEGWDDVDATVFCKELGYEAGMALPIYLYDQKVRWGYNVRCSGSEPSLLDCPYDTKSDNGSCSYGPEAGAFCYNTSELAQYRLIGGSKPNMGRVEVFTQNKWALLCDTYGFHGEKANIVCKSMGYKSGETYYTNDLNNMTGNYWKNSFSSCEYGMRLLEACKISDWKYQTASSYSECSYSQPASVYCYNEVRLSTMYANSSGAVLVFDGDNNYRSLCAAQFNVNAANVVCRQLGFPSGGRLLPGSSYLTYSIPSNISYSCSGAESKLSDCSIQASACASNNSYASVACIDDSAAPISGNDGDAIVDSQGQVLVLYHGIWGTVCSLDWGDQDASVVCKEAGHMYGKAYAKYDYGGYSNSRPVWIYGTDCSGSEAKLKDCQLRNSDDANSTCRYSPSAMAYCYNDTNSVQYSLVGSGSNYGIVQVTRDGKTGYICDDGGFYDNEAKTACKDLGFADGDNYPIQQSISSTNNWWKSYLFCHNSEPTLQLCSRNDWNYVSMNSSSYCMYNTLSVFCYGTLRLHTKFANSSGILLKRENRNYYAFCSDGFNMNSANAVCKDLGFIKARLILPASVYNIGYSIRFFNLQCSEGATSMKQCTSAYNSNANCIGEAIAVACDDGQPLVKDGLTKISADGLVEVSKNGMWGTINSHKWDDIDAQVICKENGFEAGKTLNSYMYTESARWMYEVECIGSETSIFDCPYKSSAGNASTTYYNNAGVYCYNPSTADELRLENGSYGRLLWTRNNTTGYVCDFDYIDNDDANTVCKTLGYASGYKYPSSSLPPGTEWWGASFVCNDKPILEACLMSPLQYGSDKDNSSFSKCYGDSNTFSVHCSGNATHTNHTAVTTVTPYTPNYNSTSRSTTPSQQQNPQTPPKPVDPADPPVIDTTSESTNNSGSGSSNLHTSATSFSMLISFVVMVLVCIVDHR